MRGLLIVSREFMIAHVVNSIKALSKEIVFKFRLLIVLLSEEMIIAIDCVVVVVEKEAIFDSLT